MMKGMEEMTVKKSITIDASAESVWKVLVLPSYIKLWNDLPEDYNEDEALQEGTELVWEMENNEYTKLTVTRFHPFTELRLTLFASSWKDRLPEQEVCYAYTISDLQGHTVLTITIGDFSSLQNGENYYKDSIRFADHVSEKIKALAEKESLIN